jgi:hypothetical protein
MEYDRAHATDAKIAANSSLEAAIATAEGFASAKAEGRQRKGFVFVILEQLFAFCIAPPYSRRHAICSTASL